MMSYGLPTSGLPKYGRNTDLFTSLTNAIMDGLCCQNMSAVWSEDQPRAKGFPDACFVDSTEEYEVRSEDVDDADSGVGEESFGPSLQSSAPGCVIPTCPTREEVETLPTCNDLVRNHPSPVPQEVTRQRRPLLAMNNSEDYAEYADYDYSLEQNSQASSSWIGGGGTVVTGTTAHSTPLSPSSTAFTGGSISTAQPPRIEEQHTKSPLLLRHQQQQRLARQSSPSSSAVQRHASPLQDCFYYYTEERPSSPPRPRREHHNPSFSPRQSEQPREQQQEDRGNRTRGSLELPSTPTTVNTCMAITPDRPVVCLVTPSSPPPSAIGIVYPTSTPVDTMQDDKPKEGQQKNSSSYNSPSATVTTADTSTTLFEFSMERPAKTNSSTDNDSIGTSKMSEGERRRRKLMEEKLRLSRSSSFATCSTQSSLLDDEQDEEEEGMEYFYHDNDEGHHHLILDTSQLELKLDDSPPVDEDSSDRRVAKRRHLPRLQARRQSARQESTSMYH